MSSYQQQGNWGAPTGGGAPPPPPPTLPPPAPATDVYVGGRQGKGRGKLVAAGIAAVAVLGAGTFAVAQLAGDDGGSDSPEAAVEQMLTALEQNDIVGMVDALAPGERDVVKDSLNDYMSELKRLGIVDESTDLSDVPGFTVGFEDMQYVVDERNDRVAMVEATGGSVTLGTAISELPLGDAILDALDTEIPDTEQQVTFDLAEAIADDPDADPLQVAVVKDGDRWYVSSFYTAAELAATEQGLTMPAEPIPAVGADSPEDAVVQMLGAIGDLDVARMIELTPPDEMAALHDYGQLLVDAAAESVDPSSGWDVTINDYEFDTEDVTGGTKVLPSRLDAMLTVEGETASIAVEKQDDGCVSYELDAPGDGDDLSGTACADDIREQLEQEADVPPELIDLAVREVAQLGEVGIVTTEVDGKWYVSPVRSYNDLFLVALQGMERSDVDALIELAKQSS